MTKYRNVLTALSLCLVAGAVHAAELRGVVYHDSNENGVRDSNERGVAQVAVSNGREVVLTDRQGRYTLPVEEDTVIFVIKPSGWRTPTDPKTGIAQHYYVHKPEGSPDVKFGGVAPTGRLPETLDFPLIRQTERNSFRAVVFGDTQPRNQQEVDYIAHDVLPELVGVEAAFGVQLGDIVFDDLDVFEPLTLALGQLGLPWHYVVGNHDINFDAPTTALTNETYIRVFGPPYYAFNYGPVHFISLDNIWWVPEDRKYHAELGEKQLEFVKNNLELVDQDTLVVLFMHIPLEQIVDADKAALFELLAPFKHTLSFSAHTHNQRHVFVGEAEGWKGENPHHHLVHATAGGSWWRGIPDERGIPHATMSDGGPNGYSFVHFDGNRYDITFKAAMRPADYQMSIFAPDAVGADSTQDTTVMVNAFAGSERCTVEMRVGKDGAWKTLANILGKDPYITALKAREWALFSQIARDRGIEEITEDVLRPITNEYRDVLGLPLPDPRDTPHLWHGTLPEGLAPGYHTIEVRYTDQFGKVFTAHRMIRVTP